MQNKDAKALLSKYQSGNCTEEEKAIVENWVTFGEVTRMDLSDKELANDLAEIKKGLPLYEKASEVRMWPRFVSAAAVLLIVSTGLFFYLKKSQDNVSVQKIARHIQDSVTTPISPGSNKAVITLADGSQISLTDSLTGKIAEQNGVQITKTANGKLEYSKSDDKAYAATYNTIATPRGGQFQVVLPDGTEVWLNAASSLKYPTSFNSSERRVELTGEAYFEVAHDKARPFRVISANNQEVEVLGTHFNINSYKEEREIKTTLLEGSVKVSQLVTHSTKILIPGQQAISTTGSAVLVKDADLREVVAWKNGEFVFNDQTLQTIMHQIARWYDVDIEYAGDQTGNKIFGGTISRFENINQVLEILELTGSVKFKVEGRKITVMN